MSEPVEHTAQKLAETFAERAAHFDATNEFPHENFAALQASGYLCLTIPREFGGGGCRLPELCRAQQILAGGCGATALAANMHVHTLGVAAAFWRETRDARLAAFFQAIVENGIIVAACASEQGTKGSFVEARTAAVRTNGGFLITGRKIVCSLSPAMGVVSTNAALEENGSRRLIQVVIPRDAPGLTIRETWDAMGMRATGSHELYLADVFVPDDAVIVERECGTYDVHVQEAMKWFALTVAATYTGIATAARDFVLGSFGGHATGGEQDRALRLRELGEIEVELAAAGALIERTAAAVDAEPFRARPELLARSLATKYFATNAAIRVVHACIELVGGLGYLRRCRLERYYRDVRAGIIHPPGNRDALRLIGEIGSGTFRMGPAAEGIVDPAGPALVAGAAALRAEPARA